MTTTFNPFMLTQIAGGYTFAGKTMGLVLLYRTATVSPTTPTDLTGLLAAPGFQEVSTVASPTYIRHVQNVNQTVPNPAQPAPQTQAVIYGSDWAPVPAGSNAAPVYVAAGLWYVADATPVGGVTHPWVMISDDMFGNIVSPGVRLSGTPRELFRFQVLPGGTVSIFPSLIVQSPGTMVWESARIQHVYLIPQRVNWIPNPSGEDTGMFGWRSNGALSRVQGGVDRSVNYFLRTAGTAIESISVPNQAEWRISCYARSTVGGTKFNMGLISLDETYAPVSTQMAKRTGDEWVLYPGWTRYDAIIRAMDDVVAVIPHFSADMGFDLDLCLLENSHAINAYWDGYSNTGAVGDFTWQGVANQSYSMYYCNRNITAARLFGEYKDGQVTLEALVADWVPTGTTVYTHWNVLSQFDTKHPLEDWGSRTMP